MQSYQFTRGQSLCTTDSLFLEPSYLLLKYLPYFEMKLLLALNFYFNLYFFLT